MNSKWSVSLLAAFFAVLLAGDRPAYALTTTQTMAISLTVPVSCTMSTSPLNLGTWISPNGTNTASAALTLNCSSGTPWSIDIDAGLHRGPISGWRRVTNGVSPAPSFINYNLTKDALAQQSWGTATGGTAMTGTGTGGAQTINVYGYGLGADPASSQPAPGAYSDTVTVTVTF